MDSARVSKTTRFFAATAAVLLGLLSAPAHTTTLTFSIRDLGVYSAAAFPSAALNDSGQVVVGTTLISPGGASVPIGGQSPAAINATGNVVGTYFGPTGYTLGAYLYNSATLTTLPLPSYSSASDINNSGQIVGYAGPDSSHYSAFLFDASGYHDLGLGAYSSASGINDSGVITGGVNVNSATQARAFVYDGGNVTYLLPGGATVSYGGRINAKGQVLVTGEFDSPCCTERTYIFEGGSLKALPLAFANRPDTTGNIGFGLNDIGQVVGATHGGAQVAFFFDGSAMYDLNGLLVNGASWNLHSAFAINNADQILALGQALLSGKVAGDTHYLLLTPVPIPATVLLLGTAIATLGLGRRPDNSKAKNVKCIKISGH